MARALAGVAAIWAIAGAPMPTAAQGAHRTFPTPEAAVQALMDAVKAGNLDAVKAIFGPDSGDLISSSDAATARGNQQVFIAAAAEGWQLSDQGGNRRTLIVGNEAWPFPVPLVKVRDGWQFDTAAGREEVLARRIGRNELAVIGICHTVVNAQLHYAQEGRDGKPGGRYATAFRSDPGRQNGLYWQALRGQKLSPLGDLVAQAAAEGRATGQAPGSPSPLHGYFFKMLTAQGAHAQGGAKSYVVDGEMTGGFALLAWPSLYDATGVMTFLVGRDGVVWQKDLGKETSAAVSKITAYDPDPSTWSEVR
jgi:Protein of unknown function (DUF2950)